MSRMYGQALAHDTGTISAFRSARDCNNGAPYTKAENMERSRKLRAKLLVAGYGVTKIDGTYIEGYGSKNPIEVKEVAFFVVDIKDRGNLKKDLIKFGKMFEQDSITFQEKSKDGKNFGEYYLISTNECPDGYPGEGVIGKEIKLGRPIFGKSGEFHSKINGRPFVFEEVEMRMNKISDYTPTEIRGIVHQSTKT